MCLYGVERAAAPVAPCVSTRPGAMASHVIESEAARGARISKKVGSMVNALRGYHDAHKALPAPGPTTIGYLFGTGQNRRSSRSQPCQQATEASRFSVAPAILSWLRQSLGGECLRNRMLESVPLLTMKFIVRSQSWCRTDWAFLSESQLSPETNLENHWFASPNQSASTMCISSIPRAVRPHPLGSRRLPIPL